MFEHRTDPLLSRSQFIRRLGRQLLRGGLLLSLMLLIGIMGYHFFESLSWIDSIFNASMILSGMGPANELHTTGGKLFASVYAIFSGVVFIAMMGLLLTPVM